MTKTLTLTIGAVVIAVLTIAAVVSTFNAVDQAMTKRQAQLRQLGIEIK